VLKLTCDPWYNVAYICLKEKTDRVQTIQISDELNIDMAADGTVCGTELLNANEQLATEPKGKLTQRAKTFRAVSFSHFSSPLRLCVKSVPPPVPWHGHLGLDSPRVPLEAGCREKEEFIHGTETTRVHENTPGGSKMEEQQNVMRILEGKCNLCDGIVSKRAMTNHLKSCRKQHPPKARGRAKPREQKVFHLVVEGRYRPQYWMHLEAPASAELQNLDYLLRRTWLECCGHMSAFTIAKTPYSISPLVEWEEKGMDIALDEVLRPRMRFYHKYDFGTPTDLVLRVVSATERLTTLESIEILAMNVAPEISCDVCGKPATRVCSSCIWQDEAWFCDDCAPKHKCGAEMLLPVVNSPRTGMCGYDGK